MSRVVRFSLCGAVFAALAVCLAAAVPAQVLMMPDSTNNRLVHFSPVDGSVVNPNVFALAAGTPLHAMQVGQEIWVSEQVGDRISRWDATGTFLGAVGAPPTGGLDNVRGMALLGGVIHITNSGTNNTAPGNAVVRFDTAGTNLGSFTTAALAPSPFGILEHPSGMLVSSSSANDDIHAFTLAGASAGTFHNSTSLNFAEQMDYALNGDVLVAGFSSNNVVRLDPTTGALISSFAASGARGVAQLANGNILWSNGSGAHVYNVSTGTSTQVYTGGGRYFDLYAVSYTVTPVAGPGGSLDPSTPQVVPEGQTVAFQVLADPGFAIDTVTGCGGALVGTTYTTAPVTADCTVTATFAVVTFTVTPVAGPGGSLAPGTPQVVPFGQTVAFGVLPDPGYEIDEVTGCGGTLLGETYTTAPIEADCTVSATFVEALSVLEIPTLDGSGLALLALLLAGGAVHLLRRRLGRA
ncbi:MAG: IPTL-CTERM sorting domain-containing protein [Thermoanaerobaculia bacterium]|nr:IPTL-CTERM sorting domain-containing protein [Thermoanaerobaculia bacterium]